MIEIALTIASHFAACALGFILGARWAARHAGAAASKALKNVFEGIEANIRQNEADAAAGAGNVVSIVAPDFSNPPLVVSPRERAWPRVVK